MPQACAVLYRTGSGRPDREIESSVSGAIAELEKLAIQLEDAILENEDIRSYVRELRTHGNPLVRTGPPL